MAQPARGSSSREPCSLASAPHTADQGDDDGHDERHHAELDRKIQLKWSPPSPRLPRLSGWLVAGAYCANCLVLQHALSGGRGGIRTLEAVLPPTRFPVA